MIYGEVKANRKVIARRNKMTAEGAQLLTLHEGEGAEAWERTFCKCLYNSFRMLINVNVILMENRYIYGYHLGFKEVAQQI